MKRFKKASHKLFSPDSRRQREKGFTLIELQVVVGILGTLGAVVALNVGSFIGSGACESYCTEKHNLQTAIIAYMAENSGTVPTVAQASDYLIGSLSYNFTTIAGDGELSDASDLPSGCTCGN